MRAHQIENGKVVNTINIAALDTIPGLTLIDAALGGVVGDLWDGSVFSKPLRDIPADKIAQWEAIKAKRDNLSDTGGYKVVIDAVDKWFHSDPKSKTQQIALYMLGASVPAVQWKTMDGTFVTMNQTIAAQIFNAALAKDQTLFTVAETHKTTMEASATPETYNINTGWPAGFVA